MQRAKVGQMSEEIGVPLLTTKLNIPPPRPNLVRRPRLIERLNQGLELGHSLTLVSAPAGFGKSTLVGEWVRTLQAHSPEENRMQVVPAWLSLDEGDNDLARFLTYLVTLLSQVQGTGATIGKGALSMLQAPEPPPAEPILTSLINDLAGASHTIILVLDDYHLIDTSSMAASVGVDRVLTFLLDHLPPQLHLVIATRVDPDLPLARLRARGQLSELRATDLRFTVAETAAFLNRVMGLDLSPENIAALETRTEGWIAGLQLAALALQGPLARQGPRTLPESGSKQEQKDATTLIESFTGSHRYVLDYLVEEVLEQQTESIQRFLLHTAVLDRLTGDLCDAVRFGVDKLPNTGGAGAVRFGVDKSPSTGGAGAVRFGSGEAPRFIEGEKPDGSKGITPVGEASSQAILEMLEHANLFVVPLDEERLWYRYHHLFAGLLRQRLRQIQPTLLPIIHTRAAEWFSHQGLPRAALKHSLAAGDYERAAALVKAIAIDIMQEGEHTTVIRWIDGLPEGLVKEQPYLCVLHAWALELAGQLSDAEARLVDAEKAMDGRQRHGEEDDTILGLIHSHRAYMTFMTGEHDKTIAYAHQALAQLPEKAALIRVQTALYLGVAYRYQGQFDQAAAIYNENLAAAQRIGGKLAVLAYLHLGDLHRQMACLHRAYTFYEEALLLTERQTGRPEMPYTGYAYVCIGRILREWNRLEDANRYTVKGLALCRDWNVADILALSCIELAYISRALGNDEQACASLDEAAQIMDSFSPWGSKYVAAHQAKLDLGRGDIAAAERWAEANALVVDEDFEFHREGEYLALARVLIAQTRFEEAHALAERIHRIAQKSGKRRTELEALILLALIFFEQGETDPALFHLETALSLAEPEGFIRIFVDEGPPIARLLQEALRRRIWPDYVRRLLASVPAAHAMPSDRGGSQFPSPTPHPPLLEPLSERELEVLQLIAEGRTNREIAERLYLSLNTVKAHTRNIYGKLDVHSRIQAVARARTLGILPAA